MERLLTISVIIPVFNEEHHIGACLDALLAQTVQADEIIVVDNNSTDTTANIVRGYPNVRVIPETRQGLYYARQTGMHAAHGTILCRIDADTQVDTHWVATVRGIFADTSVPAASGPVGYYDFYFPRFWLSLQHVLLLVAMRLDYKFTFGCNMAVRASVWRMVAGQTCNKPFLLEDVDIAIHLRRNGFDPVYSRRMTALVSCRRILDSWPQFNRYISKHVRTMRYHSVPLVGAYYARCMYSLFYLLLHSLVVMFNPETRRLEVSRLWRLRDHARPDPMTTGEDLSLLTEPVATQSATD